MERNRMKRNYLRHIHFFLALILLYAGIVFARSERVCTLDNTPCRPLLLQVIDSQGQPIADAAIDVSINIGTSCRDTKYYKYTSDANGAAELQVPKITPPYYTIKVSKKSHVPMGISWYSRENPVPIPELYTFTLEQGTSVGGYVKDESGNPIDDVRVELLLPTNGSESGIVRYQIYDYPVITDSNGFWRCDELPAKLDELLVKLVHPGFVSDEMYGATTRLSVEELRAMSSVSIMKSGCTLSGIVVDDNDVPVKDATVALGRDRWGSNYPSIKTDLNGCYKFNHIRAGQIILTVQAGGFAPDLKDMILDNNTPPVTFELEPGRTLKGRVVDVNGNPVAGVSVNADTWRGYRSISFQCSTDGEGRFTWPDAPADGVLFSLGKQGYMNDRQKTLTASDTEQIVTLHPELQISGTVTDAESGATITKFTLIQGIGWNNDSQTYWETHNTRQFNDLLGHYNIKLSNSYPQHFIKIEANGYKPAMSRAFKSDEGTAAFDFKLTKGQMITGTIFTPDNKPAADAKIFICTGSNGMYLRNGKPQNSREATSFETDDYGKFTVPPQLDEYLLLVLHDTGYAKLTPQDIASTTSKTLTSWSRLEGTLHVGSKPADHQRIALHYRESPGTLNDRTKPRLSMGYETTTDENGKFVLERLFAGEASISKVITTGDNSTQYMNYYTVDIPPGQSQTVTIGGTGRPVIGKVALASGGPANFRYARGNLYASQQPPTSTDYSKMTEQQKAEWLKKWYDSQNRKPSASFNILIEQDGSFRIDDVSAGIYTLSVYIHAPPQGQHRPFGDMIASVNKNNITVPDMPGGRSDEPLDLGTVQLEKPMPRSSSPFPSFLRALLPF